MKRQLCVLLVGLMLSLPGCAGGYYPAYGYRPGYNQGYSAPAYGGYGYGYNQPVYRSQGYARAYPNPGFQEHREFRPEGGRGWGGNGWGERHEGHGHHEGGEGHGWGHRERG